MAVSISLEVIVSFGGLVLAGLTFIYSELRRIDRRLTALATMALINADETEAEIPENVRETLLDP